MSRRAKVKIAANLTARRSESKSKVEISTAKNVFAQCDEILSIKVEKGDNQKQNNNVTALQEDVTEDVTTTIDEKSINGADVKPSESSSKKKIENVNEKVSEDEPANVFDEQVVTKQQQPETNVFEDWPIPPLSPSKQRFETIKEYHDPLSSPIIINNNLQPPPVPTSPFPHHPQHSRVRTESLCSMKSTMSAYNKDISGVVRKNFRTEENNRIIDTKRESKERLNNKNLEKNQLRMFDMIYYNPTSNPMKTKANPAKEKEQKKPIKLDVKIESPVVKVKEPDTLANFLVPQLKLGPNGEMILDETSLVVENEQQKQNRILLANANVVYDDELSGTYGYYTRQKRTREWPADETVKFYRCLHTIGTDFSLMLNLFPNRTRRDLKLKFKKEEKSNGALINKALLHPNMFDIDELQRELDNDEKIKKKALETKSKAEKEPQEILTQQIEEPQEILTQPIEEPLKIVNTQEVEQQELVKEQKYGHRRILIEEEDDEEVVDELNNDHQETEEDQEMLQELPEEENVAINENIDLNKKCKVETAEILNTDSIGVKEEQMTQPITNIVEAEVFAKEEQLTQPEIVEAQSVTEDYDEVAEDIVVKKETLQNTTPEIPAQEISPDESWNTEENYQTTIDVFHQQPTTSTVIAPPELSTQTPITWNPDEYYQSTNDPDVQEKMNVVDIPCTSNTPAPDEYEDLMKSIDFNSLVLAESQVDGKTVNEIYTMDSITEELSEKPLNLPQHVVDKIVSILNSADSDEEDA
ncbi:unnamed protein product [Diamesa tonsa]